MDNLTGKIIAGRYNIKELIGMGGMAAVYKAECEMLKRNVAVKVLLENLEGDTETVNNFTKEAQAVARLSHNNIVSVYDVGEDDGLNYMVMEYVEGVTLKEYISENGPFDWQEACNFCIQIGSALAEAHAHDVIHRDIKPQNILITKDKILKVTDFGIAKATGSNTVTMGNASAIGTVHYISPEQARGGYTDERSDIYSLGVVLYELLTGKVPFDGDSAIAVALMHIEKPLPDILKENPALPRALRKVVETAMAKEQFARYSTVEEFTDDLRGVLAGEEFAEVEDEEDLGATKVHSFDEEEFERERKRRALENEDTEEEAEEEPKKKKKKKIKTEEEKKADKRATILALLTVVLLFVVGFGVYSFLLRRSGQIKVPKLVLMTLEEANIEMTEKGLRLSDEVEYSLSDKVEEGKIISQNPEAGEIIKRNEEVVVVVSIGSSGGNIAVPEVVGKTAEDAISELLDLELSYEIKEEASEKVAMGKIIRQNPVSGTKVNPDETVTIVLSTGRPEEEKKAEVVVPKVKGYSLSDARDIIEANSLKLGTVSTKTSDSPKGTVISQSPLSGEKLPADSTVNLVISSGNTDETQSPSDIKVPDKTDDENEEKPSNAGSTKRYSLPIPENYEGDEEEVLVKILVDGKPTYEKKHKRGETATVEITGTGKMKIEAYVDGNLVNSQTVDFG